MMEEIRYDTHEKMTTIPRPFILRRLHSLTGIFLVLFLLEHLLTNSQAALFFGDDGRGFIDAVNFIYSLPYLPVIELTLLGVPILIHGLWGLQYIREAKINSYHSDGSTPSLPLPRNRAYTWQRITSLLLVIGIILHVGFMRFINHPTRVGTPEHEAFIVPLKMDPGLYTVSPRLGIKLYDNHMKDSLQPQIKESIPKDAASSTESLSNTFSPQLAAASENKEKVLEHDLLVNALLKQRLEPNEVAAVAPSFGTAILMMVRDTFKSVWICVLYSLFVTAACFHACNGLWTFAISWGITLTERSRKLLRFFSNAILTLLLLLGLVSIWGTYFINLKS